MDYNLTGPDGHLIDAKVTVEDRNVILHSRSGRSAIGPGRNPGYVAAFDAIFDRINIPTAVVRRVLLDSAPSHAFAEDQRTLAAGTDFVSKALDQVKNQIRSRMRRFGRTDDMPENEGNQNKKIRIEVALGDAEIVRRLRAMPMNLQATAGAKKTRSPATQLLKADVLRKVEPVHIGAAIIRIDGRGEATKLSRDADYDALAADGRKYSPSKVFTLALEEALGREVSGASFNTGWGTPCFDILEACGLWIVPREGGNGRPRPTSTTAAPAITPTDEETSWTEGNPKIVAHLKRERQPGLAAKKRARFIEANGKLWCEKCRLDPIAAYGPEAGNACIEVHHHRAHVADMLPGHETSLDDLLCLCSNCHRVLHRALALGLPFNF